MQRTHGIKRDANKALGEKADFPSVCENCLPESAFVMMMKEDLGAECKMVSMTLPAFMHSPQNANASSAHSAPAPSQSSPGAKAGREATSRAR